MVLTPNLGQWTVSSSTILELLSSLPPSWIAITGSSGMGNTTLRREIAPISCQWKEKADRHGS